MLTKHIHDMNSSKRTLKVTRQVFVDLSNVQTRFATAAVVVVVIIVFNVIYTLFIYRLVHLEIE